MGEGWIQLGSYTPPSPFVVQQLLLFKPAYTPFMECPVLRSKRKRRSKYPATSPSGSKDSYFPFTDIPRPVFRDVRLFPKFFKVKKKKSGIEKRLKRY